MNSYAANKNQSVKDTASKKPGGNQSGFNFEDNRPEAVIQSKFREMADNSDVGKNLGNFNTSGAPVQRRIHVGNEPVNPDAWRTVTRRIGSTTAHYGGGPFNIHTGVGNSNLANGPGVVPIAIPNLATGLISDHSNKQLIDRAAASNYEPEIDHIVEAQNLGSNSYSNARVLSKKENNDGTAARPVGAQINTVAHKSIRIRNGGTGYDHTVAKGGALDAFDDAEVNTFGGLSTVIDANSGDVKNNVRIDEV
ncbi:hypothetical protein [Fluviicola sp.]|uniref:hypothetical protein n=1 Tax=Fluviicola sp. TaxID=1917219 RepID=UPI00262AE945|nr:hypothetical protein [Fluviicola sp.]